MKMRKTALALILSVSCVICSGNILLVQAEEPGQVALEDGLTGYWNFDNEEEPMENKAEGSSLEGELSGEAVSVQKSDVEEFGNVLRFGTRQEENAKMTIASAINSGGNGIFGQPVG